MLEDKLSLTAVSFFRSEGKCFLCNAGRPKLYGKMFMFTILIFFGICIERCYVNFRLLLPCIIVILCHLTLQYSREVNQNFCQWEKLEMKMADFSYHRRFSLRCLSKGLIPTSIKLRSNIRTPKGQHIIYKAEKSLLNERIRNINNTIAMLKLQVDTCINLLETNLDRKSMDECYRFIDSKREKRHFQTIKCQLEKFQRLQKQKQKLDKNEGGHSKQYHDQTTDQTNEDILDLNSNSFNNSNTSNNERDKRPKKDQSQKWIHNLSSTTLIDAQMKILSRDPNFAIMQRNPPVGKHIASIENACMS